MAIKIVSTQKCEHQIGFDVTAEMIADDGRKETITFLWPYKDIKKIQGHLNDLIAKFNVAPIPEEKIFRQSEIDSILKEKKYFINGQHFPGDLQVKTIAPLGGK